MVEELIEQGRLTEVARGRNHYILVLARDAEEWLGSCLADTRIQSIVGQGRCFG
ncbi:hypothetical protein JIP62_03800 [Brevundimonas vitis]|uniref:Uncharacterized protein n=1 Tax=Brevundimonas vitisensis TaxID=2800818 RepID=A0ABX7BNU4_9CAUL|nr:hypothetical protein [Brevundimonas vitisensis]QQQ19249.1 hypothetical protein JIP62_03800 [Brevundimonas vitisensis]